METPVLELQRCPKSKSTTELLKEIAILELEVVNLEKYILSLYKKAFDRRLEEYHETQEQQRIIDSSIRRCHSSLSQHSAYTIQSPPLVGKVDEAVYSYHSMPLSFLEHACDEASDNAISLGDHLSNHNFSKVTETANWISEEMVRCISGIYHDLAANSKISHDFASPKVSSTTSMSGSRHAESNLWSPPPKIYSFLGLRSYAPFHTRGYEEFSGPYSQMVEVLQISRDSTKRREIEPLLHKFRSLVNKLDGVNPCKLRHEEKLAFWVNVHNALVMHAFLVYGVPQNKLKRMSLLPKVAYNVGSHTINVGMIQSYILGHQLPCPGQWFQIMSFHPRIKFRKGDERKLFSLNHPEPLSYFALCCGSQSDPPVRVYMPKTVFQDLIAAREEYILSNYRVHKEQNKIMLPKLVDNYVKDAALHPADFMGIIELILPTDHQRIGTCRYHQKRKDLKDVGWIPHNFSFRYQFPKDMSQ